VKVSRGHLPYDMLCPLCCLLSLAVGKRGQHGNYMWLWGSVITEKLKAY